MKTAEKLPIGIERFEEIRTEGFYYVDKTGMIKELLDNWGKVNLFTRPRRFGKSLNMYMLKSFFEIGAGPSFFEGLEISRESEICRQYLGQFPVIFVNLKDVNGASFENALAKMASLIRREARRLQFLLKSDKLTELDRQTLSYIFEKAEEIHVQQESLFVFSEMLYKHYGKPAIILIDEYDVPLDHAYRNGYYESMAEHIRSIFEMALKTNEFLHFAVLTGCLRISKESIFTGLNNFSVYSVADAFCSKYFGFTDEEVRELLSAYGMRERYEEVREWYDGHRFGKDKIYCPWDVLNYVKDHVADDKEVPKMYWINTSENAIVRRLIEKADAGIKSEIEQLIAGDSITKEIRQELTYKDLERTGDNLYSMLFSSGYLTMAEPSADKRTYKLIIPNREIRGIFVAQVKEWFQERIVDENKERLKEFRNAFQKGDEDTIRNMFNGYLQESISIRDTFIRKEKKENFYHGILLGLLKGGADWLVSSNAEMGDGYCDIVVEADQKLGFVIEIKYAEHQELGRKCKEALEQIEKNNYTKELEENGLTDIYMYGISCYKKRCEVVCRKK